MAICCLVNGITTPMPQHTIYVELLSEGVDVWRPVQAEQQPDGTFRLPDHTPEGESWRFPPGSNVRCALQNLADGSALVATELAE
jgi:hypothetical protein